ncbi:hypothetical protein PR202_ga24199 [Eleusine coracana subsp. coracana]|uniref:Uncharacterized protein n=1 Tax=Eleusine coracana subsp. coracana TaxID=191504 RepID=A0AAV5D7T4_ELECO|nr:hypothetical protein PR202_ga24199 [Eleusine coracana subsp. coracana]
MVLAEKNSKFSGEETIAEFEHLTRDAAAVQREVLRRILSENAAAEYLRHVGLAGAPTRTASGPACRSSRTRTSSLTLRASSTATPPLSSPSSPSPPSPSGSVNRSGTTQGRRKYLPFNHDLFMLGVRVYQTSFAFRNKAFPVEDGKSLQFIYASSQSTTSGGLTATTVTTNLYRTAAFKPMMRAIQSQCCSPDAVIFGPDHGESLYCHLLCGLLFSGEVRTVFAMFAHSLVLAFQTLELLWEDLCHDIRHGVLSPTRVATPDVRDAMAALLLLMSPVNNPELADEVARTCAGLKSNNWYGVIPALFPNAKYVHSIVTGSMEHYVKKLRHYGGDLPLVAMDYGASEGMVAPNVDPELPPESATFTVHPAIAYFEFIPLSHSSDRKTAGVDLSCAEPEPIAMTDVIVGEEYEVVVTTAGLYRYRLGDVVKVTGFYNSAPQIKFVCRRNLMLSINIDKNSELDLQLAVNGAANILAAENLEVTDYTSHADVSSNPGHYIVFWEINGDANDNVLQRCCDELDRGFVDPGYVGSRKVNAIGPLELQVLKRDAFQKVLRYYHSLGAPVNQFKLPRCVARSNSNVLQILFSNVDKVFFSTAYD